ncbi:MAG: PKD domain-containing protein [Ferruginibacter sp.]
MRRILFFIFLLLAEIVAAQSTSRTIISKPPDTASTPIPASNIISTPPDFSWDEVEPFVNGYSRVLRNNKFSFVDHAGQLICAVEFDAARNFYNKRSAVKKGSKWGFINESGKVIIPFQYEIVFDFKETVTGVFANGKWFLVNMNGDIIKPLNITVFYGFNKGFASIEKDGRPGTMNNRGEISFDKNDINMPVTDRIPYNRAPAPTTGTDCPDNIDFEYGSFFNWKCFIGQVDSVGNTNVITVTPSAPINNRHTLYTRTMPSPLDPYGLFPTNPPDGSNFAVRLGNTLIGAEAERIQYPIHVPLNDSNFSIKYDYAVVFEDPGHTTWTQPRFTVRLLDSATNMYVDCASFEYISTSNLPGFARSTVDTGVVYKPWSTVFVSLRGYAGKTMYLEFTTADCVRRGHWGYAYVDVEKPCGQSVQLQYECASPNITTLDGPPGFQFYNWWDSSFTNLYGNGQHVVLNPGPPVNTTVWLEMIPFNNFGCKDTIPVKITGIFNANFSMSDTVGVCAPHTFTFYNSNVPSTSAIWIFGDGTTGTGDTVTHTYTLPGNYNVTLNVVLPSGCIGTVQKTVSILEPVGTFYFNGAYFCNSQATQFDAVVNNADSLFWDFGDGIQLATILTTVFHSYTFPGLYMPFLTVQSSFGCRNTLPGPDTIRIEKLQAGFFETLHKNCGSTVVNFSDTSYSYFGIAAYEWDFGNGTTGTGNTVSHTYTATGTYNVQLIITGISGCKDTVVKPIYIQVNEPPVATITAVNVQCLSVPVVFSSSIQSVDAINYIHWVASNGSTGSGNTFTVNFTLPGTYSIQLIVGTVNGCFDTANHSITINPIAYMLQPRDQELCDGYATSAINFSGTVSGTAYTWTNNNSSIGLAASGTGDIASFTATNNTTVAITATITVTPSANNCPGPSKTFTITVNPTPGVVQPINQFLCKDDPTAAIIFTGPVSGSVYNWTNNNPGIGLAANGLGDIPSFTAINNTAAPITATISVTANANGCSGPAKVFTITVNPTADVVQPADQALCTGSTTAAINFTGMISGTVYNWTNDDPSIGLAANGTGNIASFTAINNTSAPITATITVTPAANSCPGTSKTFTIRVNPTPGVAQPLDQVLCKNDPTAAIIFTGTVSGSVYSWTNNNTLIGLAANGLGDIPSFTAINNTTQPVTATLTVTANANGCASPAKIFTITVKPLPAVTQPVDHVYCTGTATSAITFATAVSGATFNWTNDNPSIGLAASGTGDIGSFTATNNSNAPVTATISVFATANGCPGSPKTFTITINPFAGILQPNDLVLCNGTLSGAINFTGTVSGTTYNWTNSNTSIGLGASGSGDISAFTAINNSNVPVTATISVTATANGCPGQTRSFTITIDPSADVIQPLSQALCNGSTTTTVNFTGNVSGTSFSWTNNNTAIGLGAGGTGDIPAFMVVNTSAVLQTATITVTPMTGTCPGPSKIFTIRVNPTPNVVRPNTQTVCTGSTTNAVIFTGAVSNTFYNWTNNNTSIGLAANGTGNIASFIAMNNSDTLATAMITVSPVANSCPGPDTNFLVIVKPSPKVVQPNNQALCNRAITAPITFTASLSGATFSWTNSNTNIGLAGGGNGNIPPFPALNGTDAAIIALINVTASANGCIGPIKTAVITVNPTPTIVANNNMNVCLGRPVQLSAIGGAQYSWSPGNLLSCTNCSNPVSTPVDSIQYIVQGTSAAGCIAYDSVLLSVIKPFRMAVSPGDSLCIGESTGLHAIQANTYAWSPSNGLNNVHIADPVATPQVTTTYTVVGYDAHGCFTDTGHITVIVGPRPAVEIGPDISTQTGTTVTLHPSTQNGPIVSWAWTPATDLSCTDCPTPVATIKNNITYEVTIKNNFGCVATDRIRINVFCHSAQVFIPNAFTPDGDGLNDILMVRGSGISVKTFRIFNRWGELVFERTNFNANDPKYGWDGKIRGVPASPDVFVYTAEVICDNGMNYIYKGNTTVLK